MQTHLKLSILAASIAVLGGAVSTAAHAVPTPISGNLVITSNLVTNPATTGGAGNQTYAYLNSLGSSTNHTAAMAAWTGLTVGAQNIASTPYRYAQIGSSSSGYFANFAPSGFPPIPVLVTMGLNNSAETVTFSSGSGTLFSFSSGGSTVTFNWDSVTKGRSYSSNNGGIWTYNLAFSGDMSTTDTSYLTTRYTAVWSSSTQFVNFEIQADPAPVPVPASLALLGVGLLGAAGVARRSRQAVQS